MRTSDKLCFVCGVNVAVRSVKGGTTLNYEYHYCEVCWRLKVRFNRTVSGVGEFNDEIKNGGEWVGIG